MRHNHIIENGHGIIMVLLAAHVSRHKAGSHGYVGDICSADVLREDDVDGGRQAVAALMMLCRLRTCDWRCLSDWNIGEQTRSLY